LESTYLEERAYEAVKAVLVVLQILTGPEETYRYQTMVEFAECSGPDFMKDQAEVVRKIEESSAHEHLWITIHFNWLEGKTNESRMHCSRVDMTHPKIDLHEHARAP
jgi:hypothetical protein